MSVIKTQICRTSPPRCANLCPDITLTYFYFPRENSIFHLDVTPAACRLRTSPLHAAATTTAFVARCLSPPPPPLAPLPHTTTARRTPPPPSRTPSLTVVPSRGRLFNFIHGVLRPLIFHCLQFFSRSCQEGQIFQGRSLTVSLTLSRIFSLYQQLSGRVWLRFILRGTPTRGALWIASRGSSRSYT